MNNIPLYVLVNLLFGFFSVTTACVVLFYRRNFKLYSAIAILLFAHGVVAVSVGLMNSFNTPILFKLYFISRSITPIFLLMFSEYILKIKYTILVKLVVLTATWVIGIFSFFQNDMSNTIFSITGDVFLMLTFFMIIIHLLTYLFYFSEDKLLRRYLIISCVILVILLANEAFKKITHTHYNLYSPGISAFVFVNGIILIIASGGYSRMNQKFPKLFYIVLMSFILSGALKFLYRDIPFEYLSALFILSVFVLSIYYMIGEISKNSVEIRSALLISRLLSMPINDREKFLNELRQWEEITELHFIYHSTIEGNILSLNLLFQKTGRVIHKYMVLQLTKALEYDSRYVAGIEVAKFYFKKLDCHSLFQ